MFSVDFYIQELDSSIEALLQIRERLDNPQRFLRTVGSMLRDSTKQRFRDKEDPQGNPWRPLSRATEQRKGHNKILYRHGDLAKNILYRVVDNNTVAVGSTQEYAKYHQSTKPRTKIPRRAFLGVSEQDKTDIRRALNSFLRRNSSEQ